MNSALKRTGQAGPKRLAFVLPDMGGGGAERVAITLMTAFLERGYEVDLVLLRATGELLDHIPERVNVFDLKAKRISAGLLPLARYFRQRKPFAAQVRMWPLTVVGILARRLAGTDTRIIISDHSTLSVQYGRLRRKFALLKTSTRLLYRFADDRIVVSAGAADDLARISGVPRSRFKVIYNPVRPPTNSAASTEVERLWGDADGRIVTVGTLKAQKNHALLIRSFAILRRRRRARLILVGEGSLRHELEEQVRREDVADDVIFAGFRADPSPFLASADLFVLSSDYEGFGNVLVEALRQGTSVVSTDCASGPREILDDGRYGRLVPCGDAEAMASAMEEMLQAPRDPEALIRRADAISGAGIIDQYLEIMLDEPVAAG